MLVKALVMASCLLVASVCQAVEAAQVTRLETSIGPQDLSLALQALAKDRNIQLIYRSELVSDLRTEGVSGVLSLDEALTRLLDGSGLLFRYLDDDAITLVRDGASHNTLNDKHNIK